MRLTQPLSIAALVLLLCSLCNFSASAAEEPSRVPPVISGSWLKDNLKEPGIVILHVSPTRRDYDKGHIPGGHFLWPGYIITSDENESTLPAPLKDATKLLRSLGINNDSHVILCGIYGNIIPVCRIFVNLEHYGLKGRVSILNGGFEAWREAGYEASTAEPAFSKGKFRPMLYENLVNGEFVRANLEKKSYTVIDARPKPQYDGISGLPRPGHIPGAKNLPQTDLYDSKTFLFAETGKIEEAVKKLEIPAGSIPLFYCNTGNSASVGYVAAIIAGLSPLIYDGSMEEWASRPEWPIVKQ
jgi:thiosulfate/3-mercaptopyruvate sulfurtransferase